MSTVTITEIAKKLGVSKTTVSRAFNNTPGARISQKMRDRVLEVCKEVGYRPNLSALALSSSRTYVVGAVFINISNPNVGRFVNTGERVASDAGYHLILCSTQADAAREERECLMLRQRGVEGLILEHTVGNRHLQELARLNYPIVLTGKCPDAPEIDYVGFDEFTGMKTATAFLIGRGYAEIAYIGFHPTAPASKKRVEGYRDALKEAGLAGKEEWIFPLEIDGEWETIAGGERLARAFFARPEVGRPRAVVFYTDHLAMGFYRHCQKIGVRVPEDVAIVGYGNLDFGPLTPPVFPSIDLDIALLGKKAAELLIRKITQKYQYEQEGLQVRITGGSLEICPKLVRRELVGEKVEV